MNLRQLYTQEQGYLNNLKGATPTALNLMSNIDMLEDDLDVPTFKYIQELKNENNAFRNEIHHKQK